MANRVKDRLMRRTVLIGSNNSYDQDTIEAGRRQTPDALLVNRSPF